MAETSAYWHDTSIEVRRHQSPWNSLLSTFIFFAIFFGYFAYHFIVGQGYIHPYIGGYFTGACALSFPIVFYVYFNGFSGREINFIDFLFFIFILYFSFVVITNDIFGANREIVITHASYVLKFLVIFMVCRSIPIHKPFFRYFVSLSYWFMTSIVIIYSVFHNFRYSYVRPENFDIIVEDYQGIAFVYVVFSLLYLHSISLSRKRFLFYGLSLTALFFIGARSEFVGFVVVIPAVEFFLARRKLLYLFSATALALLAISAFFLAIRALPENNRVASLSNYQQDASYLERQGTLKNALYTISRNPILGDYASYLPGKYAHNIISAWVDLGFIGFIFFTLMISAPILLLIYASTRYSNDVFFVTTFSCLLFSFFLLLLAKAYIYQMVPFSIAIFAQYFNLFRHKRDTL